MRSKNPVQPDRVKPMIYQIRIKGYLDSQWTDWFDGLSMSLEEGGYTLLTGPVADQAALHGLLKKIRDLGMPLILVMQIQLHESLPYGSNKEQEMNSSAITMKKVDTRTLISTLWVVVMINMLKADILSLYIPGAVEEVAKTAAGAGASIPQLMLGAAIMMEISIAMIVLSRVLNRGVNRWMNIIVSLVTIAFVVGGGVSYPHYIFIAAVKVTYLVLIIWNAWKWTTPES